MRGVTLVELLVVLAVVGIIAAVSGVGLATLRAPTGAARHTAVETARTRAILFGEAVVVVVDSASVRLLPDGRVIGAPLGVDPLTGAPR